MQHNIKVTFQPEGRTVHVLDGTSVVEAAGKVGLVMNTPCGGNGTCGKCRVEISKGAPEPVDAETKVLTAEELKRGVRLACQTRIRDEMVITVPHESRFFEQKILLSAEGPKIEIKPVVRTLHLAVPAPTLEAPHADSDRLIEALKPHRNNGDTDCRIQLPLSVVRKLPDALRAEDGKVTVLLSETHVLDIMPGDRTGQSYGVAFDIGTTTVVGMLASLDAHKPALTAARTNPQIRFGDDVVSRIEYTQENEDGLAELQACIVDALNEIVGELCGRAGIHRTDIVEAVVAGNTTMSHLFLRIDPRHLAQAPYVAPLRSEMRFAARDIGLRLHRAARLFTVPNIAGFVGGDTVAVALATGLLHSKGNRLAIDIGTNGELIIAKDGRLVACSTAAGPALEGARIAFGMRAADGAIEKVRIGEDVEIGVIGDVPAIGICGSAIIDVVAELLRCGVVDVRGRMLPPDELPDALPEAVRARVLQDDGGVKFILAHNDETHIDGPVLVTQRDIREVQLAKGAIAAGIGILLGEIGLATDDLDEVLLAGAFGNYIRRSQAKRIGLLPDIPTRKINFVGNAAGSGARMALISRTCRLHAEEISAQCEYVELGTRPEFQMAFADAMMFPES